jgi:hypothetical protein
MPRMPRKAVLKQAYPTSALALCNNSGRSETTLAVCSAESGFPGDRRTDVADIRRAKPVEPTTTVATALEKAAVTL